MSLILLDTNILLRGADPGHSMHTEAINAEKALVLRGERSCLGAQVLVPFRSVATRPSVVNGLGLSQVDADSEIARLTALCPVFADDDATLPTWQHLVSTYGSVGKQNHDARIVAAMISNGIPSLLTFNKSDFIRYPMISVSTPTEVCALHQTLST